MLIDIDTGRTITRTPHADRYKTWMSRLTPEEIAAAKAAINAKITGGEVHTAGWMPGNKWTGTPFEPLHTKAARGDRHISGLCFGLLVWEVFSEHPEDWASGRYEIDDEPIGSRTYFRIQRNNKPKS